MNVLLKPAPRCEACQVRQRCVFAQLEPAAFDAFSAISEVHHYRAREILLRQGEPTSGLYLLRSGLVRLTHLEEDGHLHVLGLAAPATVLGLAEAVSGEPNQVNAETMKRSEVEYVPRKEFVHFLFANPSVAVPLLIHLSEQLASTLSAFCRSDQKALPAKERLFGVLAELARTCGEAQGDGCLLKARITVQDLAAHLSFSRQWTSTLLQELIREGRVRRQEGYLFVAGAEAVDAAGA